MELWIAAKLLTPGQADAYWKAKNQQKSTSNPRTAAQTRQKAIDDYAAARKVLIDAHRRYEAAQATGRHKEVMTGLRALPTQAHTDHQHGKVMDALEEVKSLVSPLIACA